MGVAGGPIMHGDKRKMAHHLIAVTEGGVRPSQKDTWAKFAECHPQRSCKAWAQSYRNHYSGKQLILLMSYNYSFRHRDQQTG